jgi:hypothetical protein
MPCPNGCEVEVHEKAMMPCWRANPATRPGFGTMMETLIDLGAVPPEGVYVDTTSAANDGKNVSSSAGSDSRHVVGGVSLDRSIENPTSGDDRELLGPSVHHIKKVLAPSVFMAVQPPWKDKRGNLVEPPEAATISQAVEAVVKPHGENVMSPRDGQVGAAYVDTLKSKDDVGQATALLSCEFTRTTTHTHTHTHTHASTHTHTRTHTHTHTHTRTITQ